MQYVVAKRRPKLLHVSGKNKSDIIVIGGYNSPLADNTPTNHHSTQQVSLFFRCFIPALRAQMMMTIVHKEDCIRLLATVAYASLHFRERTAIEEQTFPSVQYGGQIGIAL